MTQADSATLPPLDARGGFTPDARKHRATHAPHATATDAKNARLMNHLDSPTACVLCSSACALRVDVEDGRIVKIRPDKSSPITEGYACNKAASIASYVNHSQRVADPLKRRPDGTFEKISWDQAISEIAQKLNAIRKEHGPRAISLVGIGGQANHMDAAYGLGFLTGIGSRKWFNAFAQEKTQNALVESWMLKGSPSVLLHADTEHCETLLVLGTNARVSNRGHNANETLKAVASDPNRTYMVVDPRETETSKGADVHVRIRPGGDVYFLAAMAALIVQRELMDQAFLEKYVRDTGKLFRALKAVDVAEMAQRCGVDESVIKDVTDRFAATERSAILWDLGIEQNRYSTLNAYLIRVILTLTGNLGQKGGNVFLQSVGPRASGTPSETPERALVSDIEAIRALGDIGMFSPSLFPEEVLNDHPERIRAVIVEGANPMLSFSDAPRWREAFEELELRVVIEPAMTETARAADYVLPTPVGYEKWEICAFPHKHPEIAAQLRPPVVPAPPNALPEPEIYARLAEAMNLFGKPPWLLRKLGARATSAPARTAFTIATMLSTLRFAPNATAIQNRAIFWTYRTLGSTFADPALAAVWWIGMAHALTRRKAVIAALGPAFKRRTPFALGAELFRRMLAHPEGVVIAIPSEETHLEDNIGFKDKRVKLSVEPMLTEFARAMEDRFEPDPRYPLVLSAGIRTRWTANTIQRDPEWRRGKGPHCPLKLHSTDAKRLGVVEGAAVRLSTPIGSVELPAVIDDKLLPGHVTVPNGFGMVYDEGDGNKRVEGVNLNEITAANDRDPFTGCPNHKHVACSVEAV